MGMKKTMNRPAADRGSTAGSTNANPLQITAGEKARDHFNNGGTGVASFSDKAQAGDSAIGFAQSVAVV